ncbi:MAG: (deoxy)nucleoside triphosphate pyrophosphohydrolase [Planctomycetota bacterium]
MRPHDQSEQWVKVAIALVVEKMSPDPGQAPLDQKHSLIAQSGRTSGTRVLITKRKAARILGGLWELPGGKVEPNESARQAVIRELREEVAIEVEPIAQLEQVEHRYDHAHVRLIPFICKRVAGTPQALEVDELRWVSPQNLANYSFPEASLPVIQSLAQWLKRNRDTLETTGNPTTDTPAAP